MKISLRRIIMYILILSIMAMGWSFSRYTAVIESTGAENEELPVIEFSTWAFDYEGASFEGTSMEFDNMLPGDWYTTLIKVRNYEYESDGVTKKISDYDQRVILDLVTTGNLPLRYRLVENIYGAEISPFGDNTYRIDPLLFTGGYAEEKILNLKVDWPSNTKDEKYKYEIDYVLVRITAVQAGSAVPEEPEEP